MAIRSLLSTVAAEGNEDGSFIEEEKLNELEKKLVDLAGSSLLSFRLLFDCEGDELRKEARELAISLACLRLQIFFRM